METRRRSTRRGQSQSQEESAVEGLGRKASARVSTRITKHCLVCRGSYHSSLLQEDTTAAFNLFQKLVLDESETGTWDFGVESLPLCSTCTRTMVKLERINQALESLRLELQQSLELVRSQIVESEKEGQSHNNKGHHSLSLGKKRKNRTRATTEDEADDRVKEFRRIVIKS